MSSGDIINIEETRENLTANTGDSLDSLPDTVEVTVAPTPEVGTFSEEERSRLPSLFR